MNKKELYIDYLYSYQLDLQLSFGLLAYIIFFFFFFSKIHFKAVGIRTLAGLVLKQ